jgi:hypothetical protein
VVVFGDENGHCHIFLSRAYSTPASFFSLSTSSATSADLHAGLAATRLFGLDEPQGAGRCRRRISSGRFLVERLLLGLHDVGQRGVARLVEAQIGGDDGRQLDRDGLQAAVDLAGDVGRAIADLDLGGEGRLAPAKQRGQHLAGLVAVIIDGLLAEDDEVRAFLGRQCP